MKKILKLSILLISCYSIAQPTVAWQKCLGGSLNDSGGIIELTIDGGYILSGFSLSNDGDVSGNHGGSDAWVVKLNSLGVIQWQKCLGGSFNDVGSSIQQTTDGGYVLFGHTQSNNGDVSGNHGLTDLWVVKLNGLGVIQWQKCLGGSGYEEGNSIQQTTDGGYIMSGFTQSNNGDVSGHNGGYLDVWVVKLNSLGVIQWQKCLGGSSSERSRFIQQTTDGGYILTGNTDSNNGDVSGNHGGTDIWVVKLTNLGVIQWQKCLGGSISDYVSSIKQTTDGGYVLGGLTDSNNGDVSGNHGGTDAWVVKLNSLGVIQWQKCLGGSLNDVASSIQQTTDGGYILNGNTLSNDGDVSGNQGGNDAWVVKLNSLGVIQWQKCLGGSLIDGASSIQQTADGGYVLGGLTDSNNGDVSGNHGGVDIWVVKLSSNLGIEEQSYNNFLSLYPNPVVNVLKLKLDTNFENKSYSICNIEGKIVKQGLINYKITDINVEHLSKGVYFIKIAVNKAIKFIKE
jgi:hypothetical protein